MRGNRFEGPSKCLMHKVIEPGGEILEPRAARKQRKKELGPPRPPAQKDGGRDNHGERPAEQRCARAKVHGKRVARRKAGDEDQSLLLRAGHYRHPSAWERREQAGRRGALDSTRVFTAFAISSRGTLEASRSMTSPTR